MLCSIVCRSLDGNVENEIFCITGFFFPAARKKCALVTTWGSENLLLSYSGIHHRESPGIAVCTRCGWLSGLLSESEGDFVK